MQRKALLTVALAAVLVAGLVWLVGPSAAQGQVEVKGPQWEFKIYKALDADFANNQAELTFNRLAAEGWEYIGTLVSRPPLPVNSAMQIDRSLQAATCVLFKRAKR